MSSHTMSSINVCNKSEESTQLEIDKLDNIAEWQLWFRNNWYMTLYISFTYAVVIVLLKSYMRERKPFELRKLLVLWNAGLAVFSIVSTLIILENLIFLISYNGFWYTSICTTKYNPPLAAIIGQLCVWSKVVELGDTIFILLRKRPLIFLHWFHHVTVVCTCWAFSSSSFGFWLATINFFVHSIMYTYYALKGLQIQVPRSASMAITSLQIVQMVAALCVCLFVLFEKYKGDRPCETTLEHCYICLTLGVSYLLLFMNYFRKTYIGRKNIKTH